MLESAGLSAAAYIDALNANPRSLHRQRLLQQASNSLVPGELTRLYLALAKIGGNELCKLAPYYKYFIARERRRRMAQNQLTANHPNKAAQLYSTPQLGAAKKRLYILFSGDFGQFFLPGAMVLDILPPGPKDVIIVRSGKNKNYRVGVPTLGQTPYAVAHSLAARFDVATYQHVSVLGFSAGGFFAHKVAEFLNAQILITFGGVIVSDFLLLPTIVRLGITAFDPICACRPGGTMRRINVIASKNERDCLHSDRMHRLRPDMMEAHLINTGQHDVLGRMAKTRTAGVFMRLALAENGQWFRAINAPFFAYGKFVRYARKALGLQKLPAQQRF